MRHHIVTQLHQPCLLCDVLQEASEAPKRELLAELLLPANAGRAFGALTGDRNPIHMHALTSQLFGFKKPIAHAMYIVSRLEAELANKGEWVVVDFWCTDVNLQR